jgi:hypothetical protein
MQHPYSDFSYQNQNIDMDMPKAKEEAKETCTNKLVFL